VVSSHQPGPNSNQVERTPTLSQTADTTNQRPIVGSGNGPEGRNDNKRFARRAPINRREPMSPSDNTDDQSTMTFTEAAAEVLRISGKPMHYKEITEIAIEKNLLSHVGKNPEVTMGARLAALIKKEDKSVTIVRVRPGVFGLRTWSKKGAKHTDDSTEEVNALEVEAAQEQHDDEVGEPIELSGEDAKLVDMATRAAELFDEEEDDDQPILGSADEAEGTAEGQAEGEAGAGGRRRRRRRRGRGRSEGDTTGDLAQAGPGFSEGAESAEPETLRQDRGGDRNGHDRGGGDRGGIDRGRDSEQRYANRTYAPNQDIAITEGDELSGRELADAALVVLGAFDRAQGAIGIRAVAEQLAKRGRLPNDPGQATTMLAASVRADNLRRANRGERQRFRFATGNRIALTDWSMNPDLVKLEPSSATEMLHARRCCESCKSSLGTRFVSWCSWCSNAWAWAAFGPCAGPVFRVEKRTTPGFYVQALTKSRRPS
jgi:HB1, ASXL, restriction endonuclease HTH domain